MMRMSYIIVQRLEQVWNGMAMTVLLFHRSSSLLHFCFLPSTKRQVHSRWTIKTWWILILICFIIWDPLVLFMCHCMVKSEKATLNSSSLLRYAYCRSIIYFSVIPVMNTEVSDSKILILLKNRTYILDTIFLY